MNWLCYDSAIMTPEHINSERYRNKKEQGRNSETKGTFTQTNKFRKMIYVAISELKEKLKIHKLN